MPKSLTKADQFRGCIIGGAIGDALGSGYENLASENDDAIFYLSAKPKKELPTWEITDDTQLTLATIEAMIGNENIDPKTVAATFLKYYKSRKLRGLGASTLKALRELEVGGHWALVGRKGEYAAGNGAAMRVAPLAFNENLTRSELRDICWITHQNDEAYTGALCVINSLQAILNKSWTGKENLIEILIPTLPDTRVRDRLIEIKDIKDLSEVGEFGNDGYVVHSVPLAIAAANTINYKSMEEIFEILIDIGGDTDTNCSITGQIIGCLIGESQIPLILKKELMELREYQWIEKTIEEFIVYKKYNTN